MNDISISKSILWIVIIIIAAIVTRFILIWIIDIIVRQVVKGARQKHSKRKNKQALPESPRIVQRTKTLGTVLHNLATVLISVAALIIILTLLSVNTVALFASASVITAGLAFGAQNIVKDVLNGMFMVAEDQFGVGDIVEINEVIGRVESVGVRITKLRDQNGTLWYLRNGEIAKVANRSLDWTRLYVEVSFTVDTDKNIAKEVVINSLEKTCSLPKYKDKIIETSKILGLSELNNEHFTIRATNVLTPCDTWDIIADFREELKQESEYASIKIIEVSTEANNRFSGVKIPDFATTKNIEIPFFKGN